MLIDAHAGMGITIYLSQQSWDGFNHPRNEDNMVIMTEASSIERSFEHVQSLKPTHAYI